MGNARLIAWEAAYPYVIGALSAYAISQLDIGTPSSLDKFGLSAPSFFSNLLNIDFFAAGIMFSVFVFTMAPAAGFISKLEKLNLYKIFRRYTLESMILGVLAATACVPLAVATPIAMQKGLLPGLSVSAIGLSIGFFASVYRVARIFISWTNRL